MLTRIILLTLICVFSLHANTNVLWYNSANQKQLERDKRELNTQDFVNKYSDNFPRLETEFLQKEYYKKDFNPVITNVSEQEIQNMIKNQDKDLLYSIFSCPTPDKDGAKARVYSANYKAGTFQCLIYDPLPTGFYTIKIDNWNNVLDLDFAKAAQDQKSYISQAQNRAKSFNIAELEASATMSNYLNKTDLMLASILGNGDIIDTEATRSAGMVILNEDYHSLHLQDTTTATTNASNTIWGKVRGFWSSAKYIFTQVTNVDTTVKIKKKLDKMELIIQDQTDLLSATNAGLFEMYHVFNEISGGYYAALVGLALAFGLGFWFYQGIEKPEGKTKLNKGFPIAIAFAAVFLMPHTQNYKSNYQEIEIDGYSTANSYADDLAKAFINTQFKNIQNQTGIYAKEQIINSTARANQEAALSFIHADMVARCQKEDLQDFKRFAGNFASQNNLFGSTQETINLINFQTAYAPKNEGGISDKAKSSTISFCSQSYENYYKSLARFNKFEGVLKDSNRLSAMQMSNLIELQYGLYRDWGWPSVLAMPVIKYRLERVENLLKQSATQEEKEEDLIAKFANTAVYYVLPGTEKIAELARNMLSPLNHIPVVGGMLSTAGGAATGVLVMQKLLSILPAIAIMIFGAFRIVIILVKIFIFHLFTPFLMIAVLMGRQGKDAVFKFTSYVFATMLEMPLFVFGTYSLIVMQDYLNGIGKSMGEALNAIYLKAGDGLSVFDMFNNIDFYMIGAVINVSLQILSLVMIWKVIFTLHNMVLNAIQTQSENTLEGIAESAVQSGRMWSNKV